MKLFLTSALFAVLGTASFAGISVEFEPSTTSSSDVNAAVILLLIIGAVAFSGGLNGNGRAKHKTQILRMTMTSS